MLDSYEVNISTLAIIAVNDKLSRIIEKDKEFFINKSTISIIDESCRYYGSTYEGRCDGTKSLLNYSYKLPIIIEESRSLIFFPTSSPKFNTCSWISLHNVDKIFRHEQGTRILFKNGYNLIVEYSYEIIENQLMRATRLDCVLQDRKNR